MVKDLNLICRQNKNDWTKFTNNSGRLDFFVHDSITKAFSGINLSKHQARILENWLHEAQKEMR